MLRRCGHATGADTPRIKHCTMGVFTCSAPTCSHIHTPLALSVQGLGLRRCATRSNTPRIKHCTGPTPEYLFCTHLPTCALCVSLGKQPHV